MLQQLPVGPRWILAGDFNFVESRQDKNNPCSRLVPITERMLFHNLKSFLGVEDNPRSAGSLQYSWDNWRLDGVRVLARLDRVYLFRNTPGAAPRKLISYKILSDNPWSDHQPVMASVMLQEGPARRSWWKMNSCWLKPARAIIERAWHSLPPETPFFAKMKAVSRAVPHFLQATGSRVSRHGEASPRLLCGGQRGTPTLSRRSTDPAETS